MAEKARRINMKELAKLCGVSIGSVDRALHDRADINPATRKKILDKAMELGYQPHLPARSLVTGRTHTVGVVVFDLTEQFTAQLVSSIVRRLRQDGYMSSVSISTADLDEERRCIEQMWSLNVDGIIVVPINKGRKFNDYLASLRRPIVTALNKVSARWPYVGVDYRKAATDAVAYAAARGYRRILYLCSDYPRPAHANSYAITQLVTGYEEAVRRTPGIAAPQLISGADYLTQVDALKFGKQKTAILCANDNLALEALTFLTQKGVRVPEDVGLMGFDNIPVLRHVHPRLTTIDCSIQEIGTRAAECILGEFSSKHVSPVVGHSVVPGQTL